MPEGKTAPEIYLSDYSQEDPYRSGNILQFILIKRQGLFTKDEDVCTQ